MYAVTKENITIREMKVEDVIPLVKIAQIPSNKEKAIIRELKEEIRAKTEETDMIFAILYNGRVVGKIDIMYTEQYMDPKYKNKGFKTDGNMIIEIPQYEVCDKIANDVISIFVEYCKEAAFLDVLGLPKADENGFMYWRPMTIR